MNVHEIVIGQIGTANLTVGYKNEVIEYTIHDSVFKFEDLAELEWVMRHRIHDAVTQEDLVEVARVAGSKINITITHV
jgi:flagellar motor switch protein FliG